MPRLNEYVLAVRRMSPEVFAEDLQLSPELGRYEVYPIVKATNNPWHERVSVGRARNNDAVKVEAGDTIIFGRTSMTFIDAMGLHDLVSKHVQVAGSPG
jgi:hypothetical protein